MRVEDRERERETLREQRSRGNHTAAIKSFKVRPPEMFLKIHSVVAFSQADSICLTGQVVLNISQFCQRTVELLRTT